MKRYTILYKSPDGEIRESPHRWADRAEAVIALHEEVARMRARVASGDGTPTGFRVGLFAQKVGPWKKIDEWVDVVGGDIVGIEVDPPGAGNPEGSGGTPPTHRGSDEE